MRRIVFNTAAIISLVLCLIFIYSCLRSYLPTNVRLGSVDGSLMIFCWDGPVPADSREDEYNPGSEKFAGIRTMLKVMSHKSEWQILGFRSVRGGGIYPRVTYQVYAIPYWMLIPATAILPIFWLRRSRRQRMRAKAGHCLACGYDLRETKDKCPECGAAVGAAV